MSEAVIVYDDDLPTKSARLSVKRQTAETCETQMREINIDTNVGIGNGHISMEEETKGLMAPMFGFLLRKSHSSFNPTTRDHFGGKGRQRGAARGKEETKRACRRRAVSKIQQPAGCLLSDWQVSGK